MPLEACWVATCVATLPACHSSICVLLAMNLYSIPEGRAGGARNDARSRGREASEGVRVSARWIRPDAEPAAERGGGVPDVLCHHVRGDLRAAGVERTGRPPGGLRGHLPLCGAAGGRSGAGGGAALLPGAVDQSEGEEVRRAFRELDRRRVKHIAPSERRAASTFRQTPLHCKRIPGN